MRCLVAVLVAVGCHHEAPNRPVLAGHSEGAPEVRFAIATSQAVEILRTTDKGLVVERSTPVPDRVSRMVWVGPDPAVWLDMTRGEMGDSFPPFSGDEDPKPPGPHQNELGFVTANGYKKLEPLTWPPVTRRPEDSYDDIHEVTEPNGVLVAGDGGLWEKRCRLYGGPDGGWCSYEYARRYPAPVQFKVEIKETSTLLPFADVAPSSTVAVKPSSRLRHPDEPDLQEYENKQALVACSDHGGAPVVYPPPGQLDNNVDADVVWLSTDPPVFRTTEQEPDYSGFGRGPPPEERIWEGCNLSARYDHAVGGPDDVVVLIGREVSVLWRGREIAHRVDGATAVAFAPQ